MLIKLLLVILFAVLNFLRGYHWRPLCIALMVLTMGLYGAFITHLWYMLFFIAIPMGICLGLQDQNRGIWCSLVALGASVALLSFGYLAWYWWVVYCALNFALGYFTVISGN